MYLVVAKNDCKDIPFLTNSAISFSARNVAFCALSTNINGIIKADKRYNTCNAHN